MSSMTIDTSPMATRPIEIAPALPIARGEIVRACAVAFVASFSMLVIELVAARIMAPHVGVSLYTWTSIIGVILAGISLGAYLGGILADRRPHPSTLGWLLFAGGLASIAIAPLTNLIAAAEMLPRIAPELITRVLVISISVFFLPALLLGMVSPVTVKLALRNLERSGGVVGKIYAFSTLGSIVGTFATGFVLIARFGTRAILLGVSLLLIVCAIVFGGAIRRRTIATMLVVLLSAGFAIDRPARVIDLYEGLGAARIPGEYLSRESEYYTIRLRQSERFDGSFTEVLILDHLVHSINDLRDPGYFHYGYLRLFDEMLQWKVRQGKKSLRVLFLGGGGYTLPRYIETAYPNAAIDVVEIDPQVSRVAFDYLGVPRDGRIRTINADARWFVMNATERYDAVFCDAFNDLSIPFHLTTQEFARDLGRLLAPGGFLAANVIDNFPRGTFLPSYVETIRSVFGNEDVAVIAEGELIADSQATFVIAAGAELDAMLPAVDGRAIRRQELARYLAARKPIVLTDDYVPVDRLVASLFEERYRYRNQ